MAHEWYTRTNPAHRFARREIRLQLLNDLIPPPRWAGKIMELRRAVLDDNDIEALVRLIVAPATEGALEDSPHGSLRDSFWAGIRRRTFEIAWALTPERKEQS